VKAPKGLRLILLGLFFLVSWIAFYAWLESQFLPDKSSVSFFFVWFGSRWFSQPEPLSEAFR
jgi:hypothetical protein